VQVAGIEHVALGSDFDGATRAAFDTTGVVLITQGLLEAGFSEPDIAALMGGNVRRLLLAQLP
jgi:microsomal dipeptidase-like Zn-dependent dipeptidase